MSEQALPVPPMQPEKNLDSFLSNNDTNMSTTFAPTTPEVPIIQPKCDWILCEDIGDSRVRIWDLIILIPNFFFLLFLLAKVHVAIVKLKRTSTSSPIFLAFYGLVFTAAIISVLRAVVSMTVNANMPSGDYTDRILWLILRFFLLATELSVVIFGLAFGHLDSRTSIRMVLIVTFSVALIYSVTQGILEFMHSDEIFHIKWDGQEYKIFGHGGMLFWFASSIFFFVVYTVLCVLPWTNCGERFALPTKKTFYIYCFLLGILNLVQSIGSSLLYYKIPEGMCMVDATAYVYFTCFAPLVYCTFLWEFFRNSQPTDILFSYKAHIDDEEEDTVSLPHHPGATSANQHRSETDLMSNSYDSTHFDTLSPNPLYSPEFTYRPELRINSEAFSDSVVEEHDPVGT